MACLTCHDGTQAMDNILNAPGVGGFTTGGGSNGLAYTWSDPGDCDNNGLATCTIHLSPEAETNQDGRIADLLGEPLEIGTYQLAFDVGVYFRGLDGDVPFLSRVAIDFEILDSDRHYHIPLLLSRYACSSYRGS